MRSQPVLVQQVQDVVDDFVLSFCQQVRLREGRLRNTGTGIFAAELIDVCALVYRINFSTEALGL